MKPPPFDHKFVIVYIFLTPKSATPLPVGVALGECGSCGLCTSFTLLSHLMTDLDKTNVIQSQIFHRLHISNFLKGHTSQGATPPRCHTPYMPHPLHIEMSNIYFRVKSQVTSKKNY